MADLHKYVDPDVVGGDGDGSSWANAYSSLNLAEAGLQENLTDNGGDTMTIHCRSSGTIDATAVEFSGWTTNATCYLTVTQDDFPSDGVYSESEYVLHNNDAGGALTVDVEYFRIDKLQIKVTASSDTRKGIAIGGGTIGASSDIRFGNVIVKGVCSGTGAAWGIYISDGTVKVYNCVVYDFISGSDNGFRGILVNGGDAANIYNCTVFNCYWGMFQGGGSPNAYNCLVCNCADDFKGTWATIDYCASDDGDGTNAEDFTAEATDWGKVFNDYANDDFRLKNYTTSPCCVGQGTDDPGSGLYSDDICGNARTSTWDIGAFEYVSPVVNQTVTPSTQALSLSLQSPAIAYDFKQAVDTLAATLAVQSPTITLSSTQTPSTLSLSLSQHEPTIKFDMTVCPAVQGLILTVNDTVESFDMVVSVVSQALSLSQYDPSVSYDMTVFPDKQTITLSILGPTTAFDQTVLVDTLSLALSQQAPNVAYDITVLPSTQSLTLSIQNPTTHYDYLLSVATLALTLAVQDPTITSGVSLTVQPSTLGLSLSLSTPDIAYDMTALVDTLSLALSQHDVSVSYDYAVAIGAALALALTIQSPTVSTGASVTIQPTTLGLVISLNSPTTAYDYKQVVDAQGLSLSLGTPDVAYDYKQAVDAQGLSLSLNSPTVVYDYRQVVESLGMALSLRQPGVAHDYTVAIDSVLSLLMALNSPTVGAGVSVTVQPSAQGLVLGLQSPSVNYDYTQVVSTLHLIAEQYDIEVEYDFLLDVETLAMSLALNDPTISIGEALAAACFLLMKKAK